MRILAIRGCNLASLAGEFELDLVRAPLGGAGVFAIVGNTGAGKSTLLDAMCVALFDRTPRLCQPSRVQVGRGPEDPLALGATDVRTLLRRGASTGWAEVDFESGDARRYRARWSVRRARGRADGTLQEQGVTLTTLDGPSPNERLGGTKTETLRAIQQRLGLSFEQFRRSALLAQGEFAAFLRAESKDRSELLERMTGTEIYTRLSIAAHQRAAAAELRLRDARAAAMAIVVMDADARVAAEAAAVEASTAATAAGARHAAATAASAWRVEAARRRGALEAAEAAQVMAEAAEAGADGLRTELTARRRAEALRPLADEVARVERGLVLACAEAEAAALAAESAERARAAAVARREASSARHGPIRAARLAAGIAEWTAGAAAAAGPMGVMGAAAARSSGAGAGARSGSGSGSGSGSRSGSATIDDADGAAAWLMARAPLAAEVAGWRALDERFAQLAAAGDAISGVDRIVAGLAGQRAAIVGGAAAARDAHAAAARAHADAQRRVAGFRERRGGGLEVARRAEEAARRRCDDVEVLVATAQLAREAARAAAQLALQLGELAAAEARDGASARAAAEAATAARALRDERTHVVGELRKAAGYEHARAELVDGDPCPLCGADAHPWHGRGSFDGVIRDAEARLGESVAAMEAAGAELAELAARARHRIAERARLEAARAGADAGASVALARWRTQLADLGELPLADDPASAEAAALAAARAAAARDALEAARTARAAAEAAARAIADALAEVQTRQADLDGAARQVADLEIQTAALDVALERQRGERTVQATHARAHVAAVAAGVERWRAAGATVPSWPGSVAGAGQASVAGAGQASVAGAGQASVAGAGQASVAGAGQASVAGAGHASAAGAGQASVAGSDGASGELVDDARWLAAVAQARHELAAIARAWADAAERVARADAQLAAEVARADQDARAAERTAAERVARLADCRTRRDAWTAELDAVAARLAVARAEAELDAGELRRLLADGPERVDALTAELVERGRAVERARAVVAERARLRAEHAAACTSSPDALADADHLAALGTAAEAAAAGAHRLAATLAADAAASTRRATALAALAADEHAAEVDRVLGEVIGSHDGKLFRSYAQSLTLDALLAVANAHLEELAPRYQLERVPRHDLELQIVDRDLGGEIRSTQSLSGGEGFLVSLALALGLSSMSAQDVRVRTLLIDEGFGTLDPSTLDTALAVLDRLQATGRQVGVISHVPALVERVGAHVRVVQRGGGRSEVVVAEA